MSLNLHLYAAFALTARWRGSFLCYGTPILSLTGNLDHHAFPNGRQAHSNIPINPLNTRCMRRLWAVFAKAREDRRRHQKRGSPSSVAGRTVARRFAETVSEYSIRVTARTIQPKRPPAARTLGKSLSGGRRPFQHFFAIISRFAQTVDTFMAAGCRKAALALPLT